MRVGEIAALTVGDVVTVNGEVRREIKLGAYQTKGSKGRTAALSMRVQRRSWISQITTQARSRLSAYFIATKRAFFHERHTIDAIQDNL